MIFVGVICSTLLLSLSVAESADFQAERREEFLSQKFLNDVESEDKQTPKDYASNYLPIMEGIKLCSAIRYCIQT